MFFKKKSSHTELDHLSLGRLGEELAAAFLEQQGYRIVATNFTLPVGRNLRDVIVTGEIDLIAYDGSVLCFVEVKTRASDWFASPEANIIRRKQRQISRAARAYRRMFGLEGASYRFDVVTVLIDKERSSTPEVELFRGFWK